MITLYYRRPSLHLPQEAKSLMALVATDYLLSVMIFSSVHFFHQLRPSEKTFLRTWIFGLTSSYRHWSSAHCLKKSWLRLSARPSLPPPSLKKQEYFSDFYRWKWKDCFMSRRPWKIKDIAPAGDLAIDHLHHVVSGLNTAEIYLLSFQLKNLLSCLLS